MSDLVAWIKDQVRRSQLKELIKAHTGLTPPAFMAVVALAAAGTALTVSAVSSFLTTPAKQNDKSLDEIIDDEIMPYSPANQREVGMIPVFHDTPMVLEATKEEEEEEEVVVEAPVNAVEAPVNAVEVPVMKEEVVEAPAKEETTTAPTAPAAAAAAADGDINSSSSSDDDFAEVIGS